MAGGFSESKCRKVLLIIKVKTSIQDNEKRTFYLIINMKGKLNCSRIG